MSAADTTTLEKTSLEAHVDLCAMRYSLLETRLNAVEKKVDSVHQDIVRGQKDLTKVIIGTAGTVIAGMLGVVVTILMKMA